MSMVTGFVQMEILCVSFSGIETSLHVVISAFIQTLQSTTNSVCKLKKLIRNLVTLKSALSRINLPFSDP